MPEFIVGRAADIDDKQVCEKAVLLRSEGVQALAEVDYQARELVILLKGEKARDYLYCLRQELNAIFARLNLDTIEKIRLPHSAIKLGTLSRPSLLEWASYTQLENHWRLGKEEFISEHAVYSVSQVLGIYHSEKYAAQQAANLTQVFNQCTIDQQNGVNMAKQIITGGTFHAPVTNADKIENSIIGGTVNKCEISSPEVKTALEKLLKEIQDLNSKIPAEQATQNAQALSDLREDAEAMRTELTRAEPRTERFKVSWRGVVDAAQKINVGLNEFVLPVIDSAKKIGVFMGWLDE